MNVKKLFEKNGYYEYSDSQFIIFEHRQDEKSFEQIKIKRDDFTVTCSAYILEGDGFKSFPLSLNELLLKNILMAIKELKKEDQNESLQTRSS